VIKLLFLMAISIFALNDATVPYTFTTGEKILASQFNSNFDTIETWIAKTNDSIDDKFIRFSDLNGGDSTLRVDTVYGGSSVWTGIAIIDSLVVTKQIQGNIKGNVVGNVTGNITGNITGNVTGNISGATGTFSGTVIVDSLKSTKQIEANLKGNITGNLTGNVTGNASGTAATVTGAAQSAITSVGTLTGLTVSGTSTFDSTQHRTITTSGSVGIGKTAPGDVLDVNGRIRATSLRIMGSVAPLVAVHAAIGHETATGMMQFLSQGVDGFSNGGFDLISKRSNNTNPITCLRIGTNGFVGIGDTTPTEKLHVNGNIKADTLKGAVIGNVTGNVSGTAATVTGAAQAAITSVGTLTGLTMGGNITTSTNDIITDSIFARTMTTSGNVNTGSGDVTTDSIYARTIKTSGNIQADTLKGNLSLTSLSNNGTRTIFGTSKSVVEIIRDTTLSAPGTIWLLSSPSSVTTYSGEVEVFMGTLRHARKSFSWYGGSSGISLMGDSLTLYDSNPTPFGGTVQFYSYTNGSTDNKLGINFPDIGGSSAIMVYLRYTQR